MTKPARILIVDDDPGMAETLGFILEEDGHQVAVAKDGPTAIERVRHQVFDLIFMDVRLPGMNGAEICKSVKKIRPDVVVVMMTAYALEDLIQEALRAGAARVCHKPLNIPSVLQFITSYQKDE